MVELLVLLTWATPFLVGLWALRMMNFGGNDDPDGSPPPPPDPDPTPPLIPPPPEPRRSDRRPVPRSAGEIVRERQPHATRNTQH